MRARAGIQTEVLASLALVMLLATVLLSAVWVARYERTLRAVVGRALLVEALARPRPVQGAFPGTEWWVVEPDGTTRSQFGTARLLDPKSRALAARVRDEGTALLQPGAVWESMRFATPLRVGRGIVVGRLPAETSVRLRLVPLAVAGAVLLADVVILTAFGAALLQSRLVRPLQRLAAAARELAGGAWGTRVAAEGSRETAELGGAFNDMSEALERRTEELRKAIEDLRRANGDLRRARAGLDRAERLAAVGRFAAGVAHEVGNPMGAVLAFLDLAGRDPTLGPDTRAYLERAGREGERVRRILRQLLDFSRPRTRDRAVPVDLVHLARESVSLLSAQPRYAGVEFDVIREADALVVATEPGAVSQILLNLLLNAADAVSGCAERRVQLRVRPASPTPRAGEPGDVATMRRVAEAAECVVSDTGCGIPAEDRERIFDLFYTTKPPGEGTGLGLPNASRLAEELDGAVELVEPCQGFRTAVALTLPADAGGPARVRVRPEPPGANDDRD